MKKEITKIDIPGFFISEKAIKEMKKRDPDYEPFRKKGYDAKNEPKGLKSESWKDWDKRMEEFVEDFEL